MLPAHIFASPDLLSSQLISHSVELQSLPLHAELLRSIFQLSIPNSSVKFQLFAAESTYAFIHHAQIKFVLTMWNANIYVWNFKMLLGFTDS